MNNRLRILLITLAVAVLTPEKDARGQLVPDSRQNAARSVCEILQQQGLALPSCGGGVATCRTEKLESESLVFGMRIGRESRSRLTVNGTRLWSIDELSTVDRLLALADLGCTFTLSTCVIQSSSVGVSGSLGGIFGLFYFSTHSESSAFYQSPERALSFALETGRDLQRAGVCDYIERRQTND